MSLYVGSDITYVGTCEEDEAALNLSSATTTELIFRSPVSNTKTVKTATVSGDDSEILTATLPGEENTESGTWRVQPYVVIGGRPFYGKIQSIDVLPNLS